MEVREGMCSTYLVPTVPVSILLLSMTALWELLKEERSGWTTRAMEMCWATSQRGVIPSMERGPSLQLIGEYQQEMHYSLLSKASRCSFQLRRGPFVTFVCVCVCACACSCLCFRQPSVLLFLRCNSERYQVLLFLFN